MNQDTPAIEIRDKDLSLNCEAARDCMEAIADRKIQNVLDIRYGLGGWARELFSITPNNTRVVGYEQDPDTASAAWTNSKVTLLNERFDPTGKRGKVDLLLADFNVVTKLKRELLDEAISAAKPTIVIFTDVACGKLHLNYRSYGLERPELEDYWEGFRLDGYKLLKWSKRHHAASSAVFSKEHA